MACPHRASSMLTLGDFSFCFSVCLSVCFSLSVCLSFYLSVFLFFCLSVYLFAVWGFVCLFFLTTGRLLEAPDPRGQTRLAWQRRGRRWHGRRRRPRRRGTRGDPATGCRRERSLDGCVALTSTMGVS